MVFCSAGGERSLGADPLYVSSSDDDYCYGSVSLVTQMAFEMLQKPLVEEALKAWDGISPAIQETLNPHIHDVAMAALAGERELDPYHGLLEKCKSALNTFLASYFGEVDDATFIRLLPRLSRKEQSLAYKARLETKGMENLIINTIEMSRVEQTNYTFLSVFQKILREDKEAIAYSPFIAFFQEPSKHLLTLFEGGELVFPKGLFRWALQESELLEVDLLSQDLALIKDKKLILKMLRRLDLHTIPALLAKAKCLPTTEILDFMYENAFRYPEEFEGVVEHLPFEKEVKALLRNFVLAIKEPTTHFAALFERDQELAFKVFQHHVHLRTESSRFPESIDFVLSCVPEAMQPELLKVVFERYKALGLSSINSSYASQNDYWISRLLYLATYLGQAPIDLAGLLDELTKASQMSSEDRLPYERLIGLSTPAKTFRGLLLSFELINQKPDRRNDFINYMLCHVLPEMAEIADEASFETLRSVLPDLLYWFRQGFRDPELLFKIAELPLNEVLSKGSLSTFIEELLTKCSRIPEDQAPLFREVLHLQNEALRLKGLKLIKDLLAASYGRLSNVDILTPMILFLTECDEREIQEPLWRLANRFAKDGRYAEVSAVVEYGSLPLTGRIPEGLRLSLNTQVAKDFVGSEEGVLFEALQKWLAIEDNDLRKRTIGLGQTILDPYSRTFSEAKRFQLEVVIPAVARSQNPEARAKALDAAGLFRTDPETWLEEALGESAQTLSFHLVVPLLIMGTVEKLSKLAALEPGPVDFQNELERYAIAAGDPIEGFRQLFDESGYPCVREELIYEVVDKIRPYMKGPFWKKETLEETLCLDEIRDEKVLLALLKHASPKAVKNAIISGKFTSDATLEEALAILAEEKEEFLKSRHSLGLSQDRLRGHLQKVIFSNPSRWVQCCFEEGELVVDQSFLDSAIVKAADSLASDFGPGVISHWFIGEYLKFLDKIPAKYHKRTLHLFIPALEKKMSHGSTYKILAPQLKWFEIEDPTVQDNAFKLMHGLLKNLFRDCKIPEEMVVDLIPLIATCEEATQQCIISAFKSPSIEISRLCDSQGNPHIPKRVFEAIVKQLKKDVMVSPSLFVDKLVRYPVIRTLVTEEEFLEMIKVSQSREMSQLITIMNRIENRLISLETRAEAAYLFGKKNPQDFKTFGTSFCLNAKELLGVKRRLVEESPAERMFLCFDGNIKVFDDSFYAELLQHAAKSLSYRRDPTQVSCEFLKSYCRLMDQIPLEYHQEALALILDAVEPTLGGRIEFEVLKAQFPWFEIQNPLAKQRAFDLFFKLIRYNFYAYQGNEWILSTLIPQIAHCRNEPVRQSCEQLLLNKSTFYPGGRLELIQESMQKVTSKKLILPMWMLVASVDITLETHDAWKDALVQLTHLTTPLNDKLNGLEQLVGLVCLKIMYSREQEHSLRHLNRAFEYINQIDVEPETAALGERKIILDERAQTLKELRQRLKEQKKSFDRQTVHFLGQTARRSSVSDRLQKLEGQPTGLALLAKQNSQLEAEVRRQAALLEEDKAALFEDEKALNRRKLENIKYNISQLIFLIQCNYATRIPEMFRKADLQALFVEAWGDKMGIDVTGIEDFETKFMHYFDSGRMSGMAAAYTAKHIPEVRAHFSNFVRSIFLGEFARLRYEPTNEHLDILSRNFPEVYRRWQEGGGVEPVSGQMAPGIAITEERVKAMFVNALEHGHFGSSEAYVQFKTFLETHEPIPLEEQSELTKRLLDVYTCPEPTAEMLEVLVKQLSEEREPPEIVNDLKALLVQSRGTLSEDDNYVIDSDDYVDLFVCGTEVSGSCQRVDGSSALNRCLLGYVTDGKNRILAVKSPDGKILYRRIFRVLLDKDNQPALFLERGYGVMSPAFEEAVLLMAKRRAKELKLPLYEVGPRGPSLYSRGSNAPYEYCDASSSQHIAPGGVYRITSTALLQPVEDT